MNSHLSKEIIPYLIKVVNNNAFSSKPCYICSDKKCKNCCLLYDDNIKLISLLLRYPKVNETTVDNNYLYMEMIQRKYCLNRNDFELEILFNKKFSPKDSYLSQSKFHNYITNSLYNVSSISISIYDCFSLFMQSEFLDTNNAWLCSNCKSLQNAKKKIEMWKSPPILIVQLKRFRNNQKLQTLVDFPLVNLDLKYFFVNGKKCNFITIYDLFGICNHYGSVINGHYNAFCKNSLTNKWYKYDDSIITEISEKELVSQYAYVLFYRRKDLGSKSIDLSDQNNKPFADNETLKNNYIKIEEEKRIDHNNIKMKSNSNS